MTLIQRLRGGVYGLNRIALCEEAADEIEAQQRTIECLMAGMPEDGTTPVIRRIAALESEIERLTAENERLRSVIKKELDLTRLEILALKGTP